MRLVPQNDRLAVQRFEPESKSAGGIIIPDQAQAKNETVLILDVYPDWTDHDGKPHSCRFKAGSLAIVSKYSGEEYNIDRGRLKVSLVRESDVLALIELDDADEHLPGASPVRPKVVAQFGAGEAVQSYESLSPFEGRHPALNEADAIAAEANEHATIDRDEQPDTPPEDPDAAAARQYAQNVAAKEAILARMN